MVKIAFIGAGKMTEEHLKVFSSLLEVKLIGIFSRTYQKAHSLAIKYNIANTYLSIEELYLYTKADFVIVCVPVLEVKNVSKSLFKFPWNILIEKPIGYNYTESLLIYKNAQKYKANVFVGLNRRFYESTITAQKILKNIKSKRIIHIVDQEDLLIAKKNGQNKIILDNWMYANSVHIIDYLILFGRGKITKIEKIHKLEKKSALYHCVKIHFSSGDFGIYECYWNCPAPWSVIITTRKKRINFSPLEKLSIQTYPSRDLNQINLKNSESLFKSGLLNQAKNLIALSKGRNHKLVSFKDYLNTVSLVKNIYE